MDERPMFNEESQKLQDQSRSWSDAYPSMLCAPGGAEKP